jgi:hypothetical protein
METKFEIVNQNINTQFEFTTDAVIVQGNFIKGEKDAVLKSVQGNCYTKNQDGSIGTGIGNFNGYVRGGKMKYTLSEMECEDAVLVLQTIALLEPYITGEDAETSENENAE